MKGQLTVIGTQRDESGEELTTQTTAAAEYFIKNDSHYILYEEHLDDAPEATKNIIKLKNNILELTKKGAANVHMVFEPGREHTTLYSTPFGTLPLGIRTDTVAGALAEDGLKILAEYSLTSQGVCVSRCKISIKILF